MKTILITGVAGFIGYHCFTLLSKKYRVIGIDFQESVAKDKLKQLRLEKLGIDWTRSDETLNIGENKSTFKYCDIRNFDDVQKLFDEKISVVLHLAAMTGVRNSLDQARHYADTNISGFQNLLDAMRASNCRKIIFASSSSVYGNSLKYPFSETDDTNAPLSVYAATKKADELLAYAYCANTDINVIGLRLFTVYGPWNRTDMACYNFIRSTDNGLPIKLYNGGNLYRDFTFIDDVTEGIDLIIQKFTVEQVEKPGKMRIMNLGGSTPVKVLDFLQIIEKHLNKKAIIINEPANADEMLYTQADNSLIRNYIDKENFVNVDAGLERTIVWYKELQKLTVAQTIQL